MDALVGQVRDEWENMTEERKQRYKNKAAAYKQKASSMSFPSLVASQVDEEEREFTATEDAKDAQLEKMLNLPVEELKMKSFFIMSTNVLCRTSEGVFYPLELSVVEYSIEDGIKSGCSEFVYPGSVPVGYTFTAKDHSEKFHKININGHEGAIGFEYLNDDEKRRNMYTDAITDIILRIDSSRIDDKFFVFTKPEIIDQTAGSLKFLAGKDDYLDGRVVVLNVVKLLYHLCQAIGENRPIAVCEGNLNISTFDYTPNDDCKYHEELDNRYCSYGTARRICYMMSDVLLQPQLYNVEAVIGKHLPEYGNQPIRIETLKPRTTRRGNRQAGDVREDEKPDVRIPKAYPKFAATSSAAEPPKPIGIGRGNPRRM